MHQVVFYPVGNGDTSQIILENGKRILFDFRHMNKAENDAEPAIDLAKRLREELEEAGKTAFEVVAFTHGDKDHIENSTSFFELNHAPKYQGGDRIKIDCLWVPAAMILEIAPSDKQSEEFVIWRQEARHRLKKGKGIRVFSKPNKLKEWLEGEGLTVEDRKDMITDAGQLAPDFSLDADGVEFFCHSPFIKHVDEGDDLRNEAALMFNVRFQKEANTFDYFLSGDSKWNILEDVVDITKNHDNKDRLAWDLFKTPHHCSYLTLSDEKGDNETEPKPLVKELLESGKEWAYLVSSSNPICDSKEGREQVQPPHIQAKKSYQKYLDKVGGAKLLVTMEEPNESSPEPIIIMIDSSGLSVKQKALSATATLTSAPAKRAG